MKLCKLLATNIWDLCLSFRMANFHITSQNFIEITMTKVTKPLILSKFSEIWRVFGLKSDGKGSKIEITRKFFKNAFQIGELLIGRAFCENLGYQIFLSFENEQAGKQFKFFSRTPYTQALRL